MKRVTLTVRAVGDPEPDAIDQTPRRMLALNGGGQVWPRAEDVVSVENIPDPGPRPATAGETRDALWKAILEKIEELKAFHDNRGSMRGEGYYSTNNRSCLCRLSLGRHEGGDDVFLITASAPAFAPVAVRVERFHDAHDEHWTRTLAELTDRDVFIDGMQYWIGPKGARGMKGFGGRTFHIRLASGTVVTTDNLWAGSRVPPVWRDRLPDNAEFVDSAEVTP